VSQPLIGIVSRFCRPEGIRPDRQSGAGPARRRLAIVVLGAGEANTKEALHDLAKRYPEKLSVKIAYDNAIAHKIESRSGHFPDAVRYEPAA